MSDCTRCKTLDRFLTDERAAHEQTKAQLKSARTEKNTAKAELRALKKLIADATAICPAITDAIRSVRASMLEEAKESVIAGAGRKRRDNTRF